MTEITGKIEHSELKGIVERIEGLELEKKEIQDQIKDELVIAKSKGFEPAIIKKVIKIRAEDQAKREETESLVQVYMDAVS